MLKFGMAVVGALSWNEISVSRFHNLIVCIYGLQVGCTDDIGIAGPSADPWIILVNTLETDDVVPSTYLVQWLRRLRKSRIQL